MSEDTCCPKPGEVGWNELVTTSVPGAKKFYGGLLGWKSKAFGKGTNYTLFLNQKDMVGGLMKCPKPGMPAQWIPYVLVANVDASVKKAKKLGAKIAMGAFNVPDVGRIAVVIDPQGAVFGLFKPKG